MKKLLTLFAILIISPAFANTENTQVLPQKDTALQQKIENGRIQRANAFEKRLGLTEEQKIKAREIRIKGHENLEPVIREMIAKKQEAKMVKMSRIAVQVQEERLAEIDAQLKVLEKRAHNIKKQNMKEFESILTKQQKRTLKEMKKEGRKKYQSTHPTQRQVIQPTKK